MGSSSDLDQDHLPGFEFLQTAQSRTEKPKLVVLDSSDPEIPVSSSPVRVPVSSSPGRVPVSSSPGRVLADPGLGMPDVMMISSEDEEDVPYVPLAQRLKQRQEALSSSSSVTNNKDGHRSPRDHPCRGFSTHNNGFTESEPPLPLCEEEADLPQMWPPPKPSSWAGSTGTSPAKKRPSKRTPEEIHTSREEALRRREAREKQQGEKEARRQEQGREKADRRALAEAAKALRPEECIKHMVVCVDPALLQLEGGGSLLTSLQVLGCSCAIEKQPFPRSVSWTRRSSCPQTGEEVCVPEAHVVMQVPVDDFITLIHSYTQEQRGGGSGCSPSLTSWTLDLLARNPGRSPSLVVIDLETYFRSQKSQSQKKLREAVLGEEPVAGGGAVKKRRRKRKDEEEARPAVTRVEVEEAVVHLQLNTGVQVRFLSTWKDFSQHVSMTTKAVAEGPFKREREQTGFSFCLESEWSGGQRVDRAGKGLLQVWKRQIQQLNRVSPDMASAVMAAYPSPQLLNQAYRLCKSEREKISLLSDLLIRRGEGVTSTTRRIGPELSKRLFLLMTSSDPQQALDSTV